MQPERARVYKQILCKMQHVHAAGSLQARSAHARVQARTRLTTSRLHAR